MKKFTKFIGKFPFSGKISIRSLVFSLYQSTTVVERRKSYLRLVALLVLFVLVHGVQAGMGVQVLGFDSPIWAKAISGLYALINICVVLAQVHLGFRTTQFFFKGLFPRRRRSYVEYSGAEANVMCTVTLGGQIIFLLLYLLYK